MVIIGIFVSNDLEIVNLQKMTMKLSCGGS